MSRAAIVAVGAFVGVASALAVVYVESQRPLVPESMTGDFHIVSPYPSVLHIEPSGRVHNLVLDAPGLCGLGHGQLELRGDAFEVELAYPKGGTLALRIEDGMGYLMVSEIEDPEASAAFHRGAICSLAMDALWGPVERLDACPWPQAMEAYTDRCCDALSRVGVEVCAGKSVPERAEACARAQWQVGYDCWRLRLKHPGTSVRPDGSSRDVLY